MRISATRILLARLLAIAASMSLAGLSWLGMAPPQTNHEGLEWTTHLQRSGSPASGPDAYPLPNPGGKCTLSKKINWMGATREERFPSVADRVCIYMTVWYDRKYGTPEAWKSPLFYFYLNEADNTRFKRLFVSWNGTGTVLRNAIGPDFPFHILHTEEDVVRDLASYGKKKTWYQRMTTDWDVNQRIELRSNLFSYAVDMTVLLDIFREKGLFPPITAQFGDKELNTELPLPMIAKWRFVNPKHHRKPIPIVMKLESERHYNTPFPRVLRDDIPWEQKNNTAIYRGMMSGHNFAENKIGEDYLKPTSKLSHYEACMKVPRCKLVYELQHSSLVDAKLSYAFGKFTHIEGREIVTESMSMQQQLTYKIIISIEGNDVATGLKWNLLSNSVVLMPPPTKTTWAMEQLLEPWVHYVPLSDNIDNVEQMVQWVLDHDAEAQQIAQRATNFISDMFLHPDAALDNRLVMEEIAERYSRLWFE